MRLCSQCSVAYVDGAAKVDVERLLDGLGPVLGIQVYTGIVDQDGHIAVAFDLVAECIDTVLVRNVQTWVQYLTLLV